MSVLAPSLPLSWLVHSISYEEYEGLNVYSEASYKTPITLNNVRVDYASNFSRSSGNTSQDYTAVIFIDARMSSNVPSNFLEESKVTFEGNVLTIKKVIPLYHPQSSQIHHWELEVV